MKLKVLKACVVQSLLHNCETFSYQLPKDLENQYFKLIKTTLGVRQSTPILIVLIESGLLPLKGVIASRQFGFYKQFGESLHPGSSRSRVFESLKADENLQYIQHYVNISHKYTSKKDIYNEYVSEIRRQINSLADQGNYKFEIYRKMNPSLERSHFLDLPHPLSDTIIKFRLGSHKLSIETGRWKGLDRSDRICPQCNVLGDEEHYLYSCVQVRRDDLQLPLEMKDLWKNAGVFTLFSRLKDIDVL